MLFVVRNAEILLSPFPFTISSFVPAAPVPLMVGTITSGDVASLRTGKI